MRRKLVATHVVGLMLVVTTAAFAQGKSGTSQGATPQGKPFQQIQSQFSAVELQLQAMNQQIQALQTQISGVENNLQAQINAINTTLTGLQTQVADGAAATASLTARVTANEASIAALNTAVAALQAQLTAAQALIAGQTGDITALQSQVNSIQTLINAHTSQIAALQQQTAGLAQFQANLANGTCQTGEAIKDIAPGGFIVCAPAGASNLQTYTVTAGYYLYTGNNYASVGCPAGYIATGSGFSAPSYSEGQQFVSNVSYSWASNSYSTYRSMYTGWGYYSYYDGDYDSYTYPYNYYAYRNFSPLSVTQSMTNYNSASIQLQFNPQSYYSGYYYQVQATCARVQ